MKRPVLLVPILLLVAVALASGGCTRGNAETRSADAPVPVRTEAVVVERAALPVVATGTLAPKDDATLSFKVGGVVARVLVEEGQRVAAGQLLAILDFGEVDPAVTRARAAAEKAERDYARAQRLYADSVATLEQVQNAETARDAARAEYDAAEFNRRHASIVAPSAGVILRRMVEPGELVQAGTPIVSFGAMGSRSRGQVVRVALADRDVVRVRRGDCAVVRFDAIPAHDYAGTVTEIAAAADPMTGTYMVEVALKDGATAVGRAGGAGAASADGSAPILASGLVGAVEIRPTAASPVSFVPAVAVLEADGTRGVVYTVGPDQTAHRRDVTVAFVAGDRMAIAAGLDGVSRVVTDGAAYLDDRRVVEVRP